MGAILSHKGRAAFDFNTDDQKTVWIWNVVRKVRL